MNESKLARRSFLKHAAGAAEIAPHASGVMTGILGHDNDEPRPDGGVSHEYDLPPTSLLMWLLPEIQAPA